MKRSYQSGLGDVYKHDAADQLTNVLYNATNPDTTPNLWDRQVGYIFDAAGNRSNVVERMAATTNTTTYAVNNLNQYSSVTTTRQGLPVTGTVDAGVNSNKWYASTATSRGMRGLVGQSNGAFSISGVPVTNGVNNISVIVQDVSGNTATQSVNVTIVNGTTNLGYNSNGCQTNDAVWAYVYDRENRLTSATNSTNRIDYRYDALGRMIERKTSGSSVTTNRMYYAGWQMIAEYNGSGSLQRKYVCGPGIDEPVRMRAGATNYYYHPDGLGSVSDITLGTGSKQESYTYDVYGTPTLYNGSGAIIATSGMTNRVLFTARDRDPDTGQYNYRYRWYNAGVGRFIQPDPIRLDSGDLNLYRYCLNVPTSRHDPFGLITEAEAWREVELWVYLNKQAFAKFLEAYARYLQDPTSLQTLNEYLDTNFTWSFCEESLREAQRKYQRAAAAAAAASASIWGFLSAPVSVAWEVSPAGVVGLVGADLVVSAAVGYKIGERTGIHEAGAEYYSRGSIGSRLPVIQLFTPRYWTSVFGDDSAAKKNQIQ